MSRSERITIVGGGIGGMTAATALAQAGFTVTVLEGAKTFGDIGAGVTLSPNAMRGLDYLGICEAVAAVGVEPTRQRIQHWQDGQVIVAVERASSRKRYGAPYVTVHRADMHAELLRAAREAGVTLRANARAMRTDGPNVMLASGEMVTGDLLVGADGIKSVVRQRFEDTAPQFSGHVAWRAVVPVDDAVRGVTTYPGIHIGPERMITRYPVRRGTLLNIVFFARQPGWTDDGWTIPADPADLAATYEGWCDEVQAMIGAVAKVPIFKWAINTRRALPEWTIDDNVTLLGDAAHAMTPFLGHGAACAIEDGVVLARALQDSTTIAEGLRRYVAARHERCSFIQAESNANAERMQSADSAMFGMEERKDEESLGLFDYDCRTVPL